MKKKIWIKIPFFHFFMHSLDYMERNWCIIYGSFFLVYLFWVHKVFSLISTKRATRIYGRSLIWSLIGKSLLSRGIYKWLSSARRTNTTCDEYPYTQDLWMNSWDRQQLRARKALGPSLQEIGPVPLRLLSYFMVKSSSEINLLVLRFKTYK